MGIGIAGALRARPVLFKARPRRLEPSHAAGDYPSVKGATVLASSLLLTAALCGCWPFHRGPTPQQQLFDALNRGNAAQANRLWLEMSPADRLKFNHGEGIRPAVSPKQLEQQIRKHLLANQSTPNEAELPIDPEMLHGGLRNLESLAAPPRQPPPQPGSGQ